MNEYDSDQVRLMLEDHGYTLCDSEDQADIILFNTCSVRKNAENRVLGRVQQLRGLKKKKRHLIIGVMGCMANAYKEQLLKDYPLIDFISGSRDFLRVPQILDEMRASKTRRSFVDEDSHIFSYPQLAYEKGKLKAYVPIMRGCDNYCSYCIVPYVRGSEISRQPEEIIDEVTFLADQGVKEIVLLGQNVNSYGKGLAKKTSFPDLLTLVSNVTGITIVRFLTSHPKDVSIALFDIMRDNPKIEKHLHLPLQSGSDAILKAMNRRYTIESYLNNIESLRARIPEVNITTDIIVGFCGETEADFEATCEAFKKVQFDNAFIFKYSPREGTKAFALEDTVPHEEKNRRNNDLLSLHREIALAKNEALLGRIEPALVYAKSKKNKAQLKASTLTGREVVFPGAPLLMGKMVKVKLTAIVHQTFIGEICE